MVYRRSNVNYRYKGYRRGGYRRQSRRPTTSLTYGNIGRKVWRDVQTLKNFVNVEFKEDNDSVTTSPDSSGYVDLIFNAAQGDSESTRDGQSCRIKSIQFLGHIKLHASATDTQCRFILFIRKAVNNVLPTVTEVLRTANVQSLRNTDYRHDIVILKDKMFTLNANHPRQIIKFWRKLDLKVLYTRGTTTGGIASLEANGLFCLLISNESTNTPAVDLATRARYIDN